MSLNGEATCWRAAQGRKVNRDEVHTFSVDQTLSRR